MQVLALDIGTVRVGCAAADDSVRIPFPVAVWPRAKYEAEREILKLIEERKAGLLVVGIPLGPDGERTPICDSIEGFVRRIAKRSSITIVYVDESFSSEEASSRLAQGGGDRSKEIDAFAACLILERFFEYNSRQRS
jgi:putative Holliday junction resolvase